MKPQVTIIGAGFAGLTLAYELTRVGIISRVVEKTERVGGLLSTAKESFGLIESAANALIADRDIEALFKDLGLEFAKPNPVRRRRYIFWGRPRRWPMSVAATLRLLVQFLRLKLGAKSLLPGHDESVHSWARRFGGVQFEERVLSPGLQGVYAGDPRRLSARLVLSSFFKRSVGSKRGLRKGSVAPVEGMGALISGLRKVLETRGVEIRVGNQASAELATGMPGLPLVLCTSAWDASAFCSERFPKLAKDLASCESLALTSVTCFFKRDLGFDLKGFGCLFPHAQGFHNLGVLFNDCIFEGRAQKELRSETWIFGGALQKQGAAEESILLEGILQDRQRLTTQTELPVEFKVHYWPRAIPHYTVDWAKTLDQLTLPQGVYLHGNYLGRLGLSKIYAESILLARKIEQDLKKVNT